MKIAIIEPVGTYGGMDYYNLGLAYGLSECNVEILYFTSNPAKERIHSKKINIIKVFGDIWFKNSFLKLFHFFKGYLKSFLIANKNNCKIFHFHFFDFGYLNLLIILISSLFKQKKVVTLHDVNSFYKKTSFLSEKIISKIIDAVVVHNHSSLIELNKKKNKFKKVNIIPHGNYLPFVKMLDIPAKKKYINLLFFGQIKDVKGLDVLLKAMSIVIKENKNFRLTIAGRPWKVEEGYYTKLISSYKLKDYVKCHFRFIEDDEVVSFYEKSDVVVLPYKRIYQSGVLLLTMSYGRAAIVSNLEPFKEVIDHNFNGLMFETENEKSLAKCILRLNRNKIIKLVANANVTISQNYSWKLIGEKTKKLYDSLN